MYPVKFPAPVYPVKPVNPVKPVYPVTQYNYLSMTIGWMNYYKQKFYDNSDIKEQFKERGLRAYLETKMPHLFNVQTINSKYFNEFFNNSDQNLNYSLFLGVKIGKNELDFKTATEADYYVTALKMFLQNKEIFSLTQGDRQIFPTFKIPYLINDIGIMTSAYIGYIRRVLPRQAARREERTGNPVINQRRSGGASGTSVTSTRWVRRRSCSVSGVPDGQRARKRCRASTP